MNSSRASRPFALLLAALVLLLALVACNGCRPEPEPPPTATPTLPAPPTVKPTETATAAAPEPTRKPTATATAAAPTAQATATATATAPEPTPAPTETPIVVVGTPQVGWASYYAEGVFQSVMDAHRQFAKYPSDLPPVEAAAIADCRFKRDGGRIYVRPVDIETGEPLTEGRVLWVVDCAGERLSAQWMEDNNIIVEIDEALWWEWFPFHDRARGLRVEVYRLE